MTTAADYKTTLERLERDRAHAQSVADAFATAIASIRSALKAEAVANTLPLFASPTPQRYGNGALTPHARIKDAAIFAFRKAGRPIKVKEIFDIARESGWSYSKKYESFRGTVAPMLSRDPMFKKVAVGLYTLADLGGAK